MAYAVTTRTRRRQNSAMGDATLGFDWGGFFTNIGTSAGSAVPQAGVQKLTQTIVGTPKAPTAAAPATSTTAAGVGATAGGIPIWGWAVGGMGLVLILVLAMGRR